MLAFCRVFYRRHFKFGTLALSALFNYNNNYLVSRDVDYLILQKNESGASEVTQTVICQCFSQFRATLRWTRCPLPFRSRQPCSRHVGLVTCALMNRIFVVWQVIEFCKCIPEFRDLETVDQINLLRGGCLEMLVLR